MGDRRRQLLAVDTLKRETLRDLLRRVLANPASLMLVADVIANDWMPPYRISSGGTIEVAPTGLPDGLKLARPEQEERKDGQG